jgi:2-oxoglutarate ferredoxin oxidoreductase subunit delta
MAKNMGKVVVIEHRCKGCQLCIPVCPKGLLALSDRLNSAGYQVISFNGEKECSGCTLCAQVCPDVALEVYR